MSFPNQIRSADSLSADILSLKFVYLILYISEVCVDSIREIFYLILPSECELDSLVCHSGAILFRNRGNPVYIGCRQIYKDARGPFVEVVDCSRQAMICQSEVQSEVCHFSRFPSQPRIGDSSLHKSHSQIG